MAIKKGCKEGNQRGESRQNNRNDYEIDISPQVSRGKLKSSAKKGSIPRFNLDDVDDFDDMVLTPDQSIHKLVQGSTMKSRFIRVFGVLNDTTSRSFVNSDNGENGSLSANGYQTSNGSFIEVITSSTLQNADSTVIFGNGDLKKYPTNPNVDNEHVYVSVNPNDVVHLTMDDITDELAY